MRGHTWTAKLGGKTFCARCGLFALNNKLSRKAANQPCKNPKEDDNG